MLLHALLQIIPNICREHGLADQYLQCTEYAAVKERVNIETSNGTS